MRPLPGGLEPLTSGRGRTLFTEALLAGTMEGYFRLAQQLGTLAEVIEHYARAPEAVLGHSELDPLHLTARERHQLEAFLRSLSAAVRQ